MASLVKPRIIVSASPYPYPDLTLPPHTILMDLLNEINASRLPRPLTTDVCVWGDPAPYGGTAANTQIPFGTSLPSVFGTGEATIFYNRIDVSQVIAATQPGTTATMMSGVLGDLNSYYGLNLQASDIIDSAITGGVGRLNIATSSIIYTGNIILTFAAAPTASVATFTAAVDGSIPLEVHFTDTSNDGGAVISAWAWDFGDGGYSSVQSPTYTYGAAGTYSVTLTITDPNGTYTSIPQNVAVFATSTPTVTFDAAVDTGNALLVHFTDTSNDPNSTVTAWAWDFGDTTGTSSLQDPSYTYAAAGTYNVVLTITDAIGSYPSAPVAVTVA